MNKLNLQLENHQFFQAINHDQVTIFKKYQHDTAFSDFTQIDQYTLTLFKWLMRVWDCFQTLEHAGTYLAYFKNNKRYEEAEIGRIQHFNYHYFNYAITVVRIVDIMLILTNHTLRLGNPDELCRFDNISKNSWVRSAGLERILKKLNDLVKPWREPRNLFIHRGVKMDSSPLHHVEAWDLVIKRDASIAHTISASQIKRMYTTEVAVALKKFKQTDNQVFNIVKEVFSQLLPVYNFWRGILR